MNAIRRRDFLHHAALLGGPLLLGGRLPAEEKADARIVRGKEPLNLEFPFAALKGFVTPTGLHYVRNHYPIPKIDPAKFALSVSGTVRKPLKLSLDALRKLGEVTRPVTLECAGNGRALLEKKVSGVQWGLGAVSTAEWTGVPLSAVLEAAGVKPGTVEVILDGADSGDPKKPIQPATPISFARGLPLDKATAKEVLLAWAMNGEPLPAAHGAPLRAVVPGWYGCASVKWLTRVIAVSKPFWGFDQTIDYATWETEDGLPRLVPVTAWHVKSSIAAPKPGDTVEKGKPVRVHGAAWGGTGDIKSVEVSADGGGTWKPAKLVGKAVPHCWRLWEFEWTPAAVGPAKLQVRAFDGAGATQPKAWSRERRGYVINHVQTTPVVLK